jgi:hypothetical protein
MLAAMSTDSGSKKAKSLTQEAFASFLLWLSPDHELAARKYLEIRLKLVKLFVRKGCAHAEESADRTLDRAALIVHEDPAKYSSPIGLCCGVARKIWLENLREVMPETLESDEIPAPIKYNVASSERESVCLDCCLQELSARDRDLITQYHQFQGSQKIETRKCLAETYGGLNKLRVTAHRIRLRLHDCITGCVQRSAPN